MCKRVLGRFGILVVAVLTLATVSLTGMPAAQASVPGTPPCSGQTVGSVSLRAHCSNNPLSDGYVYAATSRASDPMLRASGPGTLVDYCQSNHPAAGFVYSAAYVGTTSCHDCNLVGALGAREGAWRTWLCWTTVPGPGEWRTNELWVRGY
jgi:hypothetical protein